MRESRPDLLLRAAFDELAAGLVGVVMAWRDWESGRGREDTRD
jgi:hypothetical protein